MSHPTSQSPSQSQSLSALILCISSIYTFFLLWGLLQERITTTPYSTPTDTLAISQKEYFRSPLFLNCIQAGLSVVVSASYLIVRRGKEIENQNQNQNQKQKQKQNESWSSCLGFQDLFKNDSTSTSNSTQLIPPLLSKYLLISLFQSISSQLGLLSLSHGISYPTLILGKSCKLIPVLLMNLLLYRRRFPAYKYLVVFLVTLGISLFMLFSPSSSSKKATKSSSVGLILLISNLLLDGATNSTQDQVFKSHKIKGAQMMLIMNLFSFLLLFLSLNLSIPQIPIINPNPTDGNELSKAMAFIHKHPLILRDLLTYSLAGALGQISIFETLERFGSLTLVSITVTRKLFTMLLSLFVYDHRLSPLQWIGVTVVFIGIGVEAREARRAKLNELEKKQKRKLKSNDVGDSTGQTINGHSERVGNGNGKRKEIIGKME